jgi:hypothetical protein
VLDQAVDHREAVEAGHRGQASGHGGRGPSVFFHVSGPQFEVAAAHGEGRKLVLVAPGEPLPQVAGVADPGRTGVAGQEPGDGELRFVEQRRDNGDDGGGGHDRDLL